MDLTAIEVPRHVHRRNGTWIRVETHADLAAALEEGWLINPNEPPAAEAVEAAPETADPEPVTKPKRGRPRKDAV